MTWPFGHLRPGHYGAILADPPWATALWSERGYGRAPEAHYRTMSAEEIAALPVGELAARDCLLVLWATWPSLEVALRVIAAWGFEYKTGGAWAKRTSAGTAAMGTGFILRSASEPFLLATRGRPAVGSRRQRNLIDAPRREHSRKPAEMRDLLMALRPGVPVAELFAREPWPGADVWGDQTGRFGQRA